MATPTLKPRNFKQLPEATSEAEARALMKGMTWDTRGPSRSGSGMVTAKQQLLNNAQFNAVPMLITMGARFQSNDFLHLWPGLNPEAEALWLTKFQDLVAAGIDPKRARHGTRGTLWHAFVANYSSVALQALVDAGVDPTVVNEDGETALHGLLRRANANSIDGLGEFAASALGAQAVLQTLGLPMGFIQGGGDPFAQDRARFNDQVRWVHWLVEHGCDPWQPNHEGRRALDFIQADPARLQQALQAAFPQRDEQERFQVSVFDPRVRRARLAASYGPSHTALIEGLEQKTGNVYLDRRPLAEVYAELQGTAPVPKAVVPPSAPSVDWARLAEDPERQRLLAFVGALQAEGRISAQVPTLMLFPTEEDLASGPSESDLATWFAQGWLGWQTNKGPVYTVDCRNPATGRAVSGFLFLTQAGLDEVAEELYAAHTQACASLGQGRPSSRASWEKAMRADALVNFPQASPAQRPKR